MCGSKAGRDVVHFENKTHLEPNTRHVVAKTGGFRLFDLHSEGSGGPPSAVAQGMTGVGLVGEILILAVMAAFAWWLIKKCTACKVKHEAYRGFYRAQVAGSPLALPMTNQAANRDYGPNHRATADLLREIRAARQELRAASAVSKGRRQGQAAVHSKSSSEKVTTVYDASDKESKC